MHVYAKKWPRAVALMTGLAVLMCATPAAAAVDRPVASPTGGRAYAWQPTPSATVGTWYSLTGSYSYNSAGGTNFARHDGAGRYTVRFRGIASAGTVTATAYGAGSGYCTVAYWVSDGGGGTDAHVNCYTRTGAPADSAFTISHVNGPIVGTAAYLWANQPTTANYTPSTTYQYNSAGGWSTIARTGIGSYAVTIPGLTSLGGDAQVTGYGGNATCRVVNWGPVGGGQRVNVACQSPSGAPANAYFTLSFINRTNILMSGARGAYLWAEQPSTANYVPSTTYSFSKPAGTITINRSSPGVYSAHIPAPLSVGTTHVTAYGSGTTRCKVRYWTPQSGIVVNCYLPNGWLADSRFDLAFTI